MTNNQGKNVALDGSTKPRLLNFGSFTLDLQRHGLYRRNTRVHLTSKPFKTLAVLVEHQGETVGKQQLLDAVWKDAFVTEDSLVKAVREIRGVLEDEKSNPQFIQTVPGEGYRFIADVTRGEQPQEHPEPATEVQDSKAMSAVTSAIRRTVAGRRVVTLWMTFAGIGC